MVDAALFSSNTDEWYTPRDYVEKLLKVYKIDIDAAANSSNSIVPLWFGEHSPLGVNDSLALENWSKYGDTFFLNPPFSMVDAFIKKARMEYERGANIIVLVPARVDTKWWHNNVEHVADVRNIKGRLKYGGAKNSAPFPSVLLKYTHV